MIYRVTVGLKAILRVANRMLFVWMSCVLPGFELWALYHVNLAVAAGYISDWNQAKAQVGGSFIRTNYFCSFWINGLCYKKISSFLNASNSFSHSFLSGFLQRRF